MEFFLDENGCLNSKNENLNNFSIHPLWLRERLNSENYLDHLIIESLKEQNIMTFNEVCFVLLNYR